MGARRKRDKWLSGIVVKLNSQKNGLNRSQEVVLAAVLVPIVNLPFQESLQPSEVDVVTFYLLKT